MAAPPPGENVGHDVVREALTEDAKVDLTFEDLLPASARAPPPARPVWTTVKTDSERHIERLEARLAQLQAAQRRPFADALGMPRRVAGSAARGGGRSARTVPPTAQGRQPAAGSEHIRELTEVELLALEGGGGRVPSDADNVAMLVRAARGAGDVDADDDEEPAVVVGRYAEILAARRTGEGATNGSSSSSSSSDSGSDADDDDDTSRRASATTVAVPVAASVGVVDATAGVVDATAGAVDASAGAVDAGAGAVDTTAGAVDATAGVDGWVAVFPDTSNHDGSGGSSSSSSAG